MGVHLVTSWDEYAYTRRRAELVVDSANPFPDNPMKVEEGWYIFFEFEVVRSGPFWPLLRDMAALHSERQIDMVMWEPDPVTEYQPSTGSYGTLSIPLQSSEDEFWTALSKSPTGNNAAALVYQLSVWSASGASASWGVWAERSFGLAVVCTAQREGLDAWIARAEVEALRPQDVESVMSFQFNDLVIPGDVKRRFHQSFPKDRMIRVQ